LQIAPVVRILRLMLAKRLRRLIRRRCPSWPLTTPTITRPFSATDRSLAVVAVCYNMPGQVRNTLRSLLPAYQQQIDPESYRVRLMDNGSDHPLPEDHWRVWGNVEYEYTSPQAVTGNLAVALNRGVAATDSNLICLILDGACLMSPGLLHWGVELASLWPRTLVDVRCWHLGPKLQMQSRREGYTPQVEAQLLQSIGWPEPSYRLFDISVPLLPRGGFFGRSAESTCIFTSRQFFQELGGFDERYRQPGGGLAAADLFWRGASSAYRVFTLLGEAVFHQIHGGAATGLNKDQHRGQFALWRDEYESLSRPWRGSGPDYQPIVAGHVPSELRRWLGAAGDNPLASLWGD